METDQVIRLKLWEELSHEERVAVSDSFDQKARDYRLKLESDYWKSQGVLRLLRDRPNVHCQTLKEYPPSDKSNAKLPEEPGFHLWYIVDWGYTDVGLVHVLKDSEKHLAYLKGRFAEGCRDFLVYQNSKGETLSMYHQAHDHLPHWNKDGVPWVDGYVPFDFTQLK